MQNQSDSLNILKLAPSVVTLMGLCAGLSSIHFALQQNWKYAFFFIVIASCLDGIDGRVARFLKVESDFGAQLDSLADFVNFGVAPSFLLYYWNMQNIKGFGWAALLLFTICAALRLARFNSDLIKPEERPEWHSNFFVGIPAPAGALLALLPLVIMFAFKTEFPSLYWFFSITNHPIFVISYVSAIALLMASRIPTYSAKKIHIPKSFASLLLAIAGILVIGLIIEPWMTLTLICLLYIVTLPISALHFWRLDRKL